MSDVHTGDPTQPDADAAATVASAVAAAPFVRLYGHADGDSLAAVGLLAVALRERGIPFQSHVSVDPAGAAGRTVAGAGDGSVDGDGGTLDGDAEADGDRVDDDAETDDGLAVVVTRGQRSAVDCVVPPHGDRRPASVVAAAVSRKLGVEPDPLLALAGVIAAGSSPGTDASGGLLEAADQRGLLSRRPGLALPTDDLADGLAHSTLLVAPVSGDHDAARALLTELDIPVDTADTLGTTDTAEEVAEVDTIDEAAHRRLASLVAVEAVTSEAATPAAADAVDAAVRPYATPTGPFATLGGYADVVSALAREAPGLAVALALGADVADDALATWRDHAAAAHAALAASTTGRYEGVFVCRIETDRPAVVPTVARLASAFRSPEPVTLVVSDHDGRRHAAVAAAEPRGLDAAMDRLATEFDGQAGGTPRLSTLRVDGIEESTLIAALREAL